MTDIRGWQAMNSFTLSYSKSIAIFSALFGAAFPLTAWMVEIRIHSLPLNFTSLLQLHETMVVIWLIDLAPPILGLYGFGLGRALDKLRDRLREQTVLHHKARAVLDNVADGIAMIDREGAILTFNASACHMFGYQEHEILGQPADILAPELQGLQHKRFIERYLAEGAPRIIGKTQEVSAHRKNGDVFPLELKVSELKLKEEHYFIGTFSDITEKKALEAHLLQSRNLESIGQLAAGIAHEINTPIQYIGDNLKALEQNFADLAEMVGNYREAAQGLPEGERARLADLEQRLDLEFILTDSPDAIKQAIGGAERVTQIVRAMKDYSHIDRSKISAIDINRSLENTLVVARNEYKYVADVVTDYGELPMVECFASELNQVFLNLIVNAAHAIEEKGAGRGTISLKTRQIGDTVEIAITDTGCGIPEETMGRIFDPFFTTKAIGKGTGQGLHIAHQVVQKHRGKLLVDSRPMTGSTFTLQIPIKTTSD
jgi:PAS domain S-box-containing protein